MFLEESVIDFLCGLDIPCIGGGKQVRVHEQRWNGIGHGVGHLESPEPLAEFDRPFVVLAQAEVDDEGIDRFVGIVGS